MRLLEFIARRIKTLRQMGLAEYEGRGQWRIKPDFTQTLSKMGEQNDIIKTLHRAFGERCASTLERRLEALDCANVLSKNKNNKWDISDDYLDRVKDYHKQLSKTLPTPLSRDSTLTISEMTTARGATWLDEELKLGTLEEARTSKELLDAAAKRRAVFRQMGFGICDWG